MGDVLLDYDDVGAAAESSRDNGTSRTRYEDEEAGAGDDQDMTAAGQDTEATSGHRERRSNSPRMYRFPTDMGVAAGAQRGVSPQANQELDVDELPGES